MPEWKMKAMIWIRSNELDKPRLSSNRYMLKATDQEGEKNRKIEIRREGFGRENGGDTGTRRTRGNSNQRKTFDSITITSLFSYRFSFYRNRRMEVTARRCVASQWLFPRGLTG